MQTNKLSSLAQQIREWQTQRGLSDSELCRKFTGLGSTKTFKRILDGDFEELDLERWERQYEQVWHLIEAEGQTTDLGEPIYDELQHMELTLKAAKKVIHEKGNNRLAIIEGQSGSGKTTAARCVVAHFGGKFILAEADETWKSSMNAMLGGMLRALGVQEIPNSADARKAKVIAALEDGPCVIIDEAHHMGPASMNMVKTLLNQTRVQFIFLCIPTLFRRLESLAYEEARQLTKNRLAVRIRLAGPEVADVVKFLEHRLKWEAGALKPCAAKLAERAASHGCWNFINLVVREARELVGKGEVDQETFVNATQLAQQSR